MNKYNVLPGLTNLKLVLYLSCQLLKRQCMQWLDADNCV